MAYKHTPGPWHIVWNEAEGQAYIYGRDLNTLATVWLPIHKMEEAAANARVIAEAAALYEACKALVNYRNRNTLNFQLEKADDFINAMRDAINRIHGG